MTWAREEPGPSDMKTNEGSQPRRYAAQQSVLQNCPQSLLLLERHLSGKKAMDACLAMSNMLVEFFIHDGLNEYKYI